MLRRDHQTGHHRFSRARNPAYASAGRALHDHQRIRNPLRELSDLRDEETAAGGAGRARAQHLDPVAVGEEKQAGGDCGGAEEEEGRAGEADKGEEAGGGQEEGRGDRLLEVPGQPPPEFFALSQRGQQVIRQHSYPTLKS